MSSSQFVLFIGSTSSVGQALAAKYAEDGWDIVLCARDLLQQAYIASDLRVRYGILVREFYIDIADSTLFYPLVKEISEIGNLKRVVFCTGAVDNSEANIYDIDSIETLTKVNYTGIVSLISSLLPLLQSNPKSRIILLGSVAADKGRAKNPTYCSAKAALAVYSQGLRQYLFRKNVGVTFIRLGYVDSRMSYGCTPSLFTISAESAAKQIYACSESGRDIAYIPFWWVLPMGILKMIPDGIWKRLPHF